MFLCGFSFFLLFVLLKRNLQNKLFLPVFEPSFLNHVFFCFIFLISFATWSLQKMSVSPFYVLLLFILFPSALSFLSPLVFSFLSPFSPFYFKLPFLSFYYLYVSLCKTLCQIFFILLDCSKTLFFCLLFSIKKLRFLCFLFLLGFFLHWFMFQVFFVFFCVLKKWLLILFHSPFFFILLFYSASLLYSILCI